MGIITALIQKKPVKIAYSVVILVPLGLLMVGAGYWTTTHSIRSVIQGEVYRSAQLPAPLLARAIQTYHIKTILNLRGASPGKGWYDGEVALGKRLGTEQVDIGFRAAYRAPESSFRKLVLALKTAARPILIHCEGGSERSGLGSAVALLLDGQPYQEAVKQVGWRYFVIDQYSIGKQTLPFYGDWLKTRGLVSSRENFDKWLGSEGVFPFGAAEFRDWKYHGIKKPRRYGG